MFKTSGYDLHEQIQVGTYVTVYYDSYRRDPELTGLDDEDGADYWKEIGMPPIGCIDGVVAQVYPNTFYLSRDPEAQDAWDVQIDSWEIIDIV